MYDDILTTLRSVLKKNGIKICSNPECNKIMTDGYGITDNNTHYCSIECLNKEIIANNFDRDKSVYKIECEYSTSVLEAINNILLNAPSLNEGKLGLRPIE